MATQVVAARQPFAPLNGARLQNLTSLKNRQNALTSPSKRKAAAFEDDNCENIDPIIFLSPKRSKCPDGTGKDPLLKPTNFFLTKAPPSPNDFSSCLKPVLTSPRRPILTARSPAPRLDTSISKSTPLSAPAGRSPTRKRIGILNRRKTNSPFTRVDPPKFAAASSSGLGFSIDAALSGTIPSYKPRQPSTRENALPIPLLHTPQAKDSWFFDIHEDTPEELATNLMEHSTCTLDISSDEESVRRERDNRGKENVPPPDDISQTRTSLSSSSGINVAEAEASMADLKARIRASRLKREEAEGAIECDRAPLGDLVAEDFYAEGCDGESVFLVAAEDDEEEEGEQVPVSFDFVADIKGKDIDIDVLMQKDDIVAAPQAKLFEPIEKAPEGFELWESDHESVKGE